MPALFSMVPENLVPCSFDCYDHEAGQQWTSQVWISRDDGSMWVQSRDQPGQLRLRELPEGTPPQMTDFLKALAWETDRPGSVHEFLASCDWGEDVQDELPPHAD